MKVRAIVVAAALAAVLALAPHAHAEAARAEVAITGWKHARWANNLDAFTGEVRVAGPGPIVDASVAFTYPDGKQGEALCDVDEADPEIVRFAIPPRFSAGVGELEFVIEVRFGDGRAMTARSERRRVPMSYAEELDITGDAAEVLLFPLPDDAYQVRYIPCCNIFGGVTEAERVPVNPTDSSEGLPGALVSDFVVLRPDGLSASTMGLYFDFRYDPEKAQEQAPEGVALYEFNGKDAWIETISYDVDAENHKVTVHTPEGGIYVLGKKQ